MTTLGKHVQPASDSDVSLIASRSKKGDRIVGKRFCENVSRGLTFVVPLLMVTAAPVLSAQSNGAMNDAHFFSAAVLGLNRTAAGKIFVTVEFTGKVSGQGFQGSVAYVEITRATSECGRSATLIDGAGNEYLSARCLPPLSGAVTDSDKGRSKSPLLLQENSRSQFVFEFVPVGAVRTAPRTVYSLVVPVEYRARNHRGPNTADDGQTTLSFFELGK